MKTVYNITDGTKFKIEGQDFTVTDLREFKTMWQGDTSYYGSKRCAMITADGKGDRQNFDDAIELENGDMLWIDGAKYHLILVDSGASNGVKFITDETYKAVQNTIKYLES